MKLHPDMPSSALISPCGQYRYLLTRPPLETPRTTRPPLLFCMLNPSKADADVDDPTIRRCRAMAARLGHCGIVVVNLYALRSTDPAALWLHHDPTGPDNDHHLRNAASESGSVVCAWGRHARPERVAQAMQLFRDAGLKPRSILHLKANQDGSPRHPLYVAGDTVPSPWTRGAGRYKRAAAASAAIT